MTYEKSTIQIESCGETKDKLKFFIKDTQGNWYTAFKAYNGVEKDVYSQFKMGNHGQPFKKGDTANISFKKTVGKDDQIYRNLASIFPTDDLPVIDNETRQELPSSPQGEKSSPGAEYNATGPSGRYQDSHLHEINRQNREAYFKANPPRNWEREAYEKCCSIWAAGLMQREGASLEFVNGWIGSGGFYKLFQAIKQSGEKHFEKAVDQPNVPEEVEMDGSDIPF